MNTLTDDHTLAAPTAGARAGIRIYARISSLRLAGVRPKPKETGLPGMAANGRR
jgi:hypothetical protein